jgi:aldehyde dehydrogenase (NAD+)
VEFIKENKFKKLVLNQRSFFNSEKTFPVSFRKEKLKILKSKILREETRIAEALKCDLNKCFEESYLTEISVVLQEIDYHIKNLSSWAKKRNVRTPIHLFPSRSYVQPEPLGLALIVSPWNYPFQLSFNPLIGALSSGCCAILKVSPHASKTAELIKEIIRDCFEENYVCIVEGDKQEMEFILNEKFDIIFFTGSTRVGRIVMQSAAKNLTPVILELGGKSPCIVDENAQLKIAAKRIAWSKTINAGQTCIAPDFIMIQEGVKEEFIDQLKKVFEELLGEDSSQSMHYARIINSKEFNRLKKIMESGTVRIGGEANEKTRYISPTVVEITDFEAPIMKEEIFGPILPIISYSDSEKMVLALKEMEKPLAAYYFGDARKGKKLFERFSFGGGCINDGIIHIANHHLPFGGVGNSGQGRYHGKASFEVFSNLKGIVTSSKFIDLPFRYPPYKFFRWIKKII